jgi:ubiquinone/menaquinone biosynthesis C-methylase UbiE
MSSRSTAEAVTGRAKWFADRCPRRGSLLDLCCGSGAYSVALARLAFQVVGVDSAPGMVDVATAGAAAVPGLTPAPRFLRADADARLPFDAGTFDDAICIWGLEHTLRPAATLSEIRRVLKPGGLLHVVTLSADNRYHRRHKKRSWVYRAAWRIARRAARRTMRPATRESLVGLANGAGFDAIETVEGDARCVQVLFRAR